MNRKLLISILLISWVFVGCNKRTDWSENFKEKSKDPFGLYILFNESEELLDNQKVTLLKENIYDYFNNNYLKVDFNFNYVCIKRNADKITTSGLDELLYYVSEGSSAFFSLNYFNSSLKNNLNFETDNLDLNDRLFDNYNPETLKTYQGELSFTNDSFKEKSYKYDRNLRRNYFSSYDENNTVVLGTQNIEGKEQPVFLKVYYGKGIIYLHSQPSAFTNYNMLNENYEYAEKALSYLPSNETFWDPQIRRSKLDNRPDESEGDSESVFSFFLKHQSLQWSLYLGLIGLLTFILFNARRKQRAIPVINPPTNSTVEFTHTIANLYLLNKDHKDIAQKKIQYFLEKVRSKYYLDTQNLNSYFIERLALKSGNDKKSTKELINYILTIDKKTDCSADELMTMHKMIEKFLK